MTAPASDHKQRALIKQWRQGANEATTADAAATYTECADALEAAIAVRILTAVCEGCGKAIEMPTKNPRKVLPDLPIGWSQCGISRHRVPDRPTGARLAAWCPSCRAQRGPR